MILDESESVISWCYDRTKDPHGNKVHTVPIAHIVCLTEKGNDATLHLIDGKSLGIEDIETAVLRRIIQDYWGKRNYR